MTEYQLPPAQPPAPLPPPTTSGIDASVNLGNAIGCLRTAKVRGRPVTFVCRYYNTNNPRKNLTQREAIDLSGAGLSIVAIWENGFPTTRDYFTRARGARDGEAAFRMAFKFGQPAETPVYFAVDYDAFNNADRTAVRAYFEGVRAGLRTYLSDPALRAIARSYTIGVYGSSCVLDWCQDQGIATFFWQAHAPGWCGGRNRARWPNANIRQIRNERELCGVTVDLDEGWGHEGAWSLPTAPWMDWPLPRNWRAPATRVA
jgi:hypothetical protein